MKQQITQEQFNELDKSLKLKIYNIWAGYNAPEIRLQTTDVFNIPELFTITYMIEFLNEEDHIEIDHRFYNPETGDHDVWRVASMHDHYDNEKYYPELCDALWEAVKEVLNEKTL